MKRYSLSATWKKVNAAVPILAAFYALAVIAGRAWRGLGTLLQSFEDWLDRSSVTDSAVLVLAVSANACLSIYLALTLVDYQKQRAELENEIAVLASRSIHLETLLYRSNAALLKELERVEDGKPALPAASSLRPVWAADLPAPSSGP